MAESWQTNDELFAVARQELFPAVVGDVMDAVGLRTQFLPPEIRPLHPDMRLFGRAMTVTVVDIDDTNEDPPFGLMFEALDSLRRNEVYVCTGGSLEYALWGELMSTRARVLGSAGAVVDGYYRDSQGIVDLCFPTFGRGSYAQDQGPRGKVAGYGSRIRIGSVGIENGDVVVGDRDGVCIVPKDRVDEVFRLAIERTRDENLVRKSIEAGMSSADAFRKYGIM